MCVFVYTHTHTHLCLFSTLRLIFHSAGATKQAAAFVPVYAAVRQRAPALVCKRLFSHIFSYHIVSVSKGIQNFKVLSYV